MTRYPNVQYVHFYTDGSAARKLEPVIPFKKNTVRIPAQKKSKRKVIYLDPVAIFSMAVALCLFALCYRLSVILCPLFAAGKSKTDAGVCSVL